MYVVLLVEVLIVTSGVFGQGTETDRPEVQDRFAAVGSSVKIPCTDREEKAVEWRLNNSLHVSSQILSIQNISLKDGGLYTCHGTHGDLLLLLHLHIGSPPTPPNVHCWSPSYPKSATCSWTLSPDPLPYTHYIASYRCDSDPLLSFRHCHKWENEERRCLLKDLKIFVRETVFFNVTAINSLGSATSLLPFIFEDIVKPDPPVNVTLMARPGRSLLVQWDPPPTWPDPVNFRLKYAVHFHWGNPKTTRTLGPYESNNMVLRGLVAGRTYYIQMSAKDLLDEGQSSDWTQPVNETIF